MHNGLSLKTLHKVSKLTYYAITFLLFPVLLYYYKLMSMIYIYRCWLESINWYVAILAKTCADAYCWSIFGTEFLVQEPWDGIYPF